MLLNAAPRTVTGDEMVGQPIQPERALLPTITDAKPARERPSSSVAAPYKRFAALRGRSDKGPRGSGQFDSGSPAVAAPRFVAPARRDREDAPRGKLLGNQDAVQAWHSGSGAAPIQGLTRGGRAFVLHRLEGPLTEFVVVFTTERR